MNGTSVISLATHNSFKARNVRDLDEVSSGLKSMTYTLFLAHRIRISYILSCFRNSYLTHVILPRLLRVCYILVVLELTRLIVK